MSHWLSQISSFSIGQSVVIAVVCDVTGASPDGGRGILVLNEEMIATNIINDKRRDMIIADAKELMEEKKCWSDVTYTLGEVLSKANGNCRVIYQYFEDRNHDWIQDAQSLICNGNNVWVAFRKGASEHNSSTIDVLADDGYAALNSRLKEILQTDINHPWHHSANENTLRTTILSTQTEQVLLLPVGPPPDPIIVIGRHRVAVETIRQLALLPLSVEWFAEEFIDTDPSGPLINQQLISALHSKPRVDGTIMVVMSNDHQQDLELCERALRQTGVTFVGCIGSAKKAALLKGQLLHNGINQSQLAKLHIPIGLAEISGKHPSLIAASVVAQILTVYQPGCDDQLELTLL